MKSIKTLIAVFVLLINCHLDSLALKTPAGATSISIAGLIVDSKTLLPIPDAIIYDEENKQLGVADANGFFNIKIDLVANDDINFKLIVRKNGYTSYTQKEHWANLSSDLYATYYFGMQNASSKSNAFSEFIINNSADSYDEVKDGFTEIKEKIDFENKIENAKTGNDNLFFEIEKNYYLISEAGWLKLTSLNDFVLINGKKSTPANEINSYVKRSSVKKMTPVENKDIPFEVFTY